MSFSTYFNDAFYDPFFTISDFNRLFSTGWDARTPNTTNSLVRNGESPSAGRLYPQMDLHESKENSEWTATFELPGLKKENVSIDVQNNRLIISGESTVSNESSQEGYTIRERRFGKFSRTLPLPQGIKPEDIKASMNNGVLTVKFPKSRPDQEPKKITIA